MRKKFVFFLFSFLILAFSFVLVSSAPNQISSIAPRTIGPYSSFTFNMHDWFESFDSWYVYYTVDGLSSGSYSSESSSCTKAQGVVRVCVGTYNPTIYVENLGTAYRHMNFTVYASDGVSNASSVFDVYFGEPNMPYQVASIPKPNLGTNGTIVYNLYDYFNNFERVCFATQLMNVSNSNQNITSLTYVAGTSGYKNCIDGGFVSVNYTFNRGYAEINRNSFTDSVWYYTIRAYGNESILRNIIYLTNPYGAVTYDFLSVHSATTNYEVANWSTNVSSTPGAPFNLISLAPVTLGSGDTLFFRASDYFGGNVTDFALSWEDTVNQQTAYVNTFSDGPTSTYSGLISAKIVPSGSDFNVTITGLGNSAVIPIRVIAKNIRGESQNSFTLISLLSSTSGVIGGTGNVTSTTLKNGSSFVGALVGVFDDVFPAKETLSLKFRLAFVFVTLLLINLVVFFMMHSAGSLKFLGWVLLVMDVFVIFYFFAIQYIPISILIVIVLFLLLFSYFKVKGGG